MSRYIDTDTFDDTVQKLNEKGWRITNIDYKRMDRVLFEMQTADVVEVVRCKDCTRQMICFHSDDYFCADGERRE